MSIVYTAQTVPSQIRNVTGDRGDFAKLQTEQLSVGHSPQTFVVGTPQFPTINSALDRLQGVQSRETTIQILPGVYDETLHLDDLSSSLRFNFNPAIPLPEESRGLFIVGDTRSESGVTYLSGGLQTAWASRVWDSPTAPTQIVAYDPPLGTVFGEIDIQNVPTPGVPSNTVNIIIVSAPSTDFQDRFLLSGSIVQPDFTTLGVVLGDRISICDNANNLSFRTITLVSGNQIGFDGAPALFDNDGSAITFLPNVTVLNTTAATDTCVVSSTSLTMKGIHFEVSPTSFNVRNNVLLVGGSVVQTPNCVFSDLAYVTESNVYVTGEAMLLNGDRSNGRQVLDPAVTGYPIPYTYNNPVAGNTGNLPFSVIGGGNSPNFFVIWGGLTVDKGGSLQDGSLWIVHASGPASNFAFGLSGLACSSSSLSSLQTTGGGFSLHLQTSNLTLGFVAAYLKAGDLGEILDIVQGSTYSCFSAWQKFSGSAISAGYTSAILVGHDSNFNLISGAPFITASPSGFIMKNVGSGMFVQNNSTLTMPLFGSESSFDNIAAGGDVLQSTNSGSIDFGVASVVNITNSSNVAPLRVIDNSTISFGRDSILTIDNVIASNAMFILQNQSRITFNRNSVINILPSSTGPLSLSYGQSVLNLNNTNLTNQGTLVHTLSEPLSEPVDSQTIDGSGGALALTLDPSLDLTGELCFAARTLTLYSRGTPQAHTLTLTTGNFVGTSGVGDTIATFAGLFEGEGLTFKVLSASRVQVLSFTGVVFS